MPPGADAARRGRDPPRLDRYDGVPSCRHPAAPDHRETDAAMVLFFHVLIIAITVVGAGLITAAFVGLATSK
jgi:hypothetical protein